MTDHETNGQRSDRRGSDRGIGQGCASDGQHAKRGASVSASGARKEASAERVRRILRASALDPVSAGDPSASSDASAEKDPDASRTFFRPENEDDDGYDPYSDRPGTRTGWEADPWS